MRTKVLLFASLLLGAIAAHAQGTAFTYQGRLNDGTNPAHGVYDLRFKLFEDPDGNNQAGSTLLTNGLSLTGGLFTVALDFGAGIFNGSNYWLEVDVRTNGGSGYANLNPLQPILPTPYAIFANTASNLSGTISSMNLSGTYGSAVVLNNGGNSFNGSYSGNGANITNVNAAMLNGFSAANFWKTAGNGGTTAGVNFVGTTDNQPLELRVNNQRALRLMPDGSTNNSPVIVGGSPVNTVGSGLVGVTIAGGGAPVYAGFSATNSALGDFNTIGGGWGNTTGSTNFDVSEATVAGGGQNTADGISSFIGGGAFNHADGNNATVAGGLQNRANYHGFVGSGFGNLADGYEATVGGGHQNIIETNTMNSIIGGGIFNTIQGDSYEGGGTIGGGARNLIQPSAVFDSHNPYGSGYASSYSTIGGGWLNQVQSNSAYGTIAGGLRNTIQSNVISATIGGGQLNTVQSNSYYTTIGGGSGNNAGSWATIAGGQSNIATNIYSTVGGGSGNNAGGGYATVSGGSGNTASGDHGTVSGGGNNAANGSYAAVSGGTQNTNGGAYSVIGGGQFNGIQSSGNFCVIPGGFQNVAGGFYSFAAGARTWATNSGSFVWGDGSGQITASTNDNSVTMRAAGGYRLLSSGSEPGPGVYLAPFGTSWTTISDRNAKKNFAPVNTESVLDKLAAIPVQEWNYKWEPDNATPNLGPMAQDFKAAFYPGRDDKSISTLEFDGVELAAIQGLNRKLQEKDVEIQQLQKSVAELRQLVSQLATDKISPPDNAQK